MSVTVDAEDQPKEVAQIESAVASIKGITEVEVQKTYLPDIDVANLNLPGAFADLPIAAIRRTKGSLPGELLMSINFRIQRNESGLNALEFLSWWVRDQSRGGENMQLRSIGLPPLVGNQKQLGQTLRFTIDWFYTQPDQDVSKLLSAIGEKAKSIEAAVKFYRSAF